MVAAIRSRAGAPRALTPLIDPLCSLLDPAWRLMGPAVLVVMLAGGVLNASMPRWPVAVLALSAAALCGLAPHFVERERRLPAGSGSRYVLLAVAVLAPMFLAGAAATLWAREGTLHDHTAVCMAMALGLMATGLLHGRLPGIVSAQLGLWMGGAAFDPGLDTFSLLVAGTGAGSWFIWREARLSAERRQRREAGERQRRRAEELLFEYEESGQGWFWETDRRGQITYVSPRIVALVGLTEDAVLGRPFISLFHLEAREQESERTLMFHLSTRSSFQELPVRAATAEEEERWWSITGRPVLDQFNNFLGFRGSGIDLTEARKSQRHVTELARFDSLTKLANRFQMSEWLEKILAAPRSESRACGVFLLDLDRFKQVNDTMGHPAGDALLVQVANRLRSTVSSAGRVGRLGGDEFQIILPGHTARDKLAHLAQRIIENVSQPYMIDGSRVSIGVSLGIALCPEDGITAEELIRNADLALYAAKDGGRGRHHFYAKDLHSEAQERQQLEQDLRDAIASGSLELHYQPQVRTTTERITGFEALLRWDHPQFGYLSPAKFVPIAEDSGLVNAIGEWALRTACHDLARWPEDVRIAVNVSPLQFANPALPAIVTSAIASAGISPGRLELEITESVFLDDIDSTESMFAALKGLGVRLALDDFGTGYSSLGYLRKAPFDKIKIDQSFVRGATIAGSRNGAIIAAIVSLAEALGMETTAEGVETMDELDLVRMLGCSHVQGYIYERPLCREEVGRRLQEGLVAVARGPRSARPPRQTMLRKVLLEHGAHRYPATIRNISQGGAMIEGLWDVPVGTEFVLHLGEDQAVAVSTRWSRDDRIGVEFASMLEVDAAGAVILSRQFTTSVEPAPHPAEPPLPVRKAG